MQKARLIRPAVRPVVIITVLSEAELMLIMKLTVLRLLIGVRARLTSTCQIVRASALSALRPIRSDGQGALALKALTRRFCGCIRDYTPAIIFGRWANDRIVGKPIRARRDCLVYKKARLAAGIVCKARSGARRAVFWVDKRLRG